MTTRRAECSCGQLSATCSGEPVRIAVCHCLACKRKTGSAFGFGAWFGKDDVLIGGRATEIHSFRRRRQSHHEWILPELRCHRVLEYRHNPGRDRGIGRHFRRSLFPAAICVRLPREQAILLG